MEALITIEHEKATPIKISSRLIKVLTITLNSPDNSLSKDSNIDNLITIEGILDDKTRVISAELFEWARKKANEVTAYRKVDIRIFGNAQENPNELYRTVIIPKAFVIDYNEDYKGGKFTLKFKQKVEEVEKIEISSEVIVYDPVENGFEEQKEKQ
jgi:hypothetical protein